MTALTIRLNDVIDEKLNDISEKTNLTKSALITYAINEHLRQNKPVHDFNVVANTSIRMTLRLSDEMNELLEGVSIKTKIAKNAIINYVINHYLCSVWINF